MLASATGAIVGGGLQAGAAVAGTAVTGAAAAATSKAAASADKSDLTASDAGNYFIDALFRKDTTSGVAGGQPTQAGAESKPTSSTAGVSRIFFNSLRAGTLPPEDLRYVAQIVAQRTSLSQADAEKRVTEAYTRMLTKLREAETSARDAADKTRKATAYAAIWMFVSLLLGAFVASLTATLGGRQRDQAHLH